jgi:hypothetical protein
MHGTKVKQDIILWFYLTEDNALIQNEYGQRRSMHRHSVWIFIELAKLGCFNDKKV